MCTFGLSLEVCVIREPFRFQVFPSEQETKFKWWFGFVNFQIVQLLEIIRIFFKRISLSLFFKK